MNHRTQLQFNLGVAPKHTNLATNFNPSHTSPVTIQKTSLEETIGMSHTPVQEFKAASTTKLALAMKLAKRHVKISNAPHLRQEGVDCDEDDSDSDEEDSEIPEDPPRKQDSLREYSRNVPESIGRELGQLELELDKRIKRLHRATAKKAERPASKKVEERLIPARGAGPDVRVVNSKIQWENLDETEEREQRRRGEQWARNTRLVYDLSQQVRVQHLDSWKLC
jgi:hypothetical protein